MELSDVKAIVTGGAQGMGAHFARRLREAGAKVAVGDVNEQMMSELPEGIFSRKLDVSSSADCRAFVGWAAEQMGGVNVLVSNAGILRDGLLVRKNKETGEVEVMSDEQWNAVIAVNLTGASIMVRELAREERIVAIRITIPDRPGVLGVITTTIGTLGGNILEVSHHRLFLKVPAKGASVDVTLETRDAAHANEIIAGLEAKGFDVARLGEPSEELR